MANVPALAAFAAKVGLSADHARALPTVVTVCAQKTGMTEAAFMRAAWDNAPLRKYIAQICAREDVQAVLS